MTYYIQNADVAWRVYDGEAVLVDPVDSFVRQLSRTGSHLWEFLEKARSIEQCAKELVEHFDVEIIQARLDSDEFVRTLLEKNLLTRTGEVAGQG